MALPRLFAFTNTHTLKSGEAISGDVYFSPDTGLITPNYTRSRPEISEGVVRLDLNGEFLVASGFLEVQINGIAGVHFTSLGKSTEAEDEVKLTKVSRELARFGVTGFLATVPTVEVSRWKQILPRLRPRGFDKGASLLGVHVEGPYLNDSKQGAHDARFFHEPATTDYEELYGSENLRSTVKIITLAPELPGAYEMIKSLGQKYPHITISLGHSAATYEQGQEALNIGARGLTHVFNAMNPFQHRDPGLIGLIANNPSSDIPQDSILSPSEHLLSATVSVEDWLSRQMGSLNPSLLSTSTNTTTTTTTTTTNVSNNPPPKPKQQVFYTLIPDLIHIHPASLAIAYRTSPHHAILITDAIELTNLPDGTYPPNDQISTRQVKTGNKVTKSNSSALVGSCITLDQGVRNMVQACGCTLAEAVRCVTENVARYLDRGDTVGGRGRLDVGCRADFVVLDRQGNVCQTWIAGVKIWDCQDQVDD